MKYVLSLGLGIGFCIAGYFAGYGVRVDAQSLDCTESGIHSFVTSSLSRFQLQRRISHCERKTLNWVSNRVLMTMCPNRPNHPETIKVNPKTSLNIVA